MIARPRLRRARGRSGSLRTATRPTKRGSPPPRTPFRPDAIGSAPPDTASRPPGTLSRRPEIRSRPPKIASREPNTRSRQPEIRQTSEPVTQIEREALRAIERRAPAALIALVASMAEEGDGHVAGVPVDATATRDAQAKASHLRVGAAAARAVAGRAWPRRESDGASSRCAQGAPRHQAEGQGRDDDDAEGRVRGRDQGPGNDACDDDAQQLASAVPRRMLARACAPARSAEDEARGLGTLILATHVARVGVFVFCRRGSRLAALFENSQEDGETGSREGGAWIWNFPSSRLPVNLGPW